MSGGADLDAGMLAGAGCGDLDKLAWLAGKDGHLVDVVDGVYGRTPMHFAAEGGHAAAVEKLHRLGSTALDRPDKAGRTPM